MAIKIIRADRNRAISGTVGVTCHEGDLLAVDTSGNFIKANDGASGAIAQAVGVAARTALTAPSAMVVYPVCVVAGLTTSDIAGLDAGRVIYTSPNSAPNGTSTSPTTAGWLIQPVGVALSANTVAFNIEPTSLKFVVAPGGTVTLV